MKKSQLSKIIKEEISKVLNESTESELIDIYKPTTFWKDFREVLKKGLEEYKLEARISLGGSDWNIVELPFSSNTWGVSTRTVQPRFHGSGIDDNELMSKTQINITVLTDDEYQKVINGEKISLDGIMDISMVVERNHADGNFAVRSSELTWFHPFKNSVFTMDLGMSYSAGNSGRELVDYIVREIKYAVKKRGTRIKGAIFKVV